MSAAAEIELQPGFQDALNHIANYEPKAVSWLGLHGLGPSTQVDIDKHLSDVTGIQAVTYHRAITPFAVATGFASVEYRQSQYSRRIVRYFETQRADDALPVIGVALSWADRHALPLTPFVSYTEAGEGVKQRAPMNSIKIFAAILNGERLVDSQDTRELGTFSMNRVENMLRDEIIQVDDDTNRFSIVDPTYRGTIRYERLASETRATYAAFAEAKELGPQYTWSVEEIVQLAKKHQGGSVNSQWEAAVRRNVRRAAFSVDTKSFNGVVKKQAYVRGAYQINPNYEVAVNELVEDVRNLSVGTSRHLKRLASAAFELYEDSEAVHDLVARGFDSNPKHSYSLDQAERVVS